MKTLNQIITNIINDVKVEVTEEFDRNFERKAFFDKKWTANKLQNFKGSMMSRTNNLRRGNRSQIINNSIHFSNSLPYAYIQNNGGKVKVTAKMKKFFWKMYYQSVNQLKYKKDRKSLSQSKTNLRLSIEAEQWKALALMKIGKIITIPERKFIGDHPQIHTIIKKSIDRNMEDMKNYILTKLKKS
ncbi:hypothetical protein Ga0061079_11610 [Apibacter mensalis]|uniref:Phage virion morphogenesis family protein n=1 Tax=Apibacter mensalis TaxID=1586267 RepID=A0A0X3ATA1_9FLAO|nr:hypothetical protein [Apibacter mensalis]CVK17108.1 hypothetical protein Ga0061079_11610 [Apibacter mensalis]